MEISEKILQKIRDYDTSEEIKKFVIEILKFETEGKYQYTASYDNLIDNFFKCNDDGGKLND